MKKNELSPGIIEYVFEPKNHDHCGSRIMAIINDDAVILIDTGYEDEAGEVVRDLSENQLTIDKVIISHFHNDHMEGLKVITGVPVYGSSYYRQTLDRWTPKEEQKYFIPTILIEKPEKISFGNHHIELIPFQGHSMCTMLIKINNEFLHIADELMFSNNGEPILPFVTKEDVERQYRSANRLNDYSSFTFIPGHGSIIKTQHRIENEIKNVSSYLHAIFSNKEKITYEEATKNCSCKFLHKEWFEYAYE